MLFPVIWCSMEGVVDMVKAWEDVWEMGIIVGITSALEEKIVWSAALNFTVQ